MTFIISKSFFFRRNSFTEFTTGLAVKNKNKVIIMSIKNKADLNYFITIVDKI